MSLSRRFAHLVRVKAAHAARRRGAGDGRAGGGSGDRADFEAEVAAAEHALAEVTADAERVEREGRRLQAEAAALFELAMAERQAGRDDAAAEVLTRRAAIEPQLVELKAQHARLEAEVSRLGALRDRLRR